MSGVVASPMVKRGWISASRSRTESPPLARMAASMEPPKPLPRIMTSYCAAMLDNFHACSNVSDQTLADKLVDGGNFLTAHLASYGGQGRFGHVGDIVRRPIEQNVTRQVGGS